ncbi:Histidine kinase [Rhodovastum atsumiense]|uniref:histidine kinase n=1 Tax=Rhodovastum atsumiense TaxID=504468 RepID=A0A5M6IYJ7_9PROT|nr:response regulator [Rhodovastum atsumiense]KAA5613420.1 response regulator [Rhodovastum atsumiense]CAH2603148.1 Histidine kinase [Rhodovastum atsumiense]
MAEAGGAGRRLAASLGRSGGWLGLAIAAAVIIPFAIVAVAAMTTREAALNRAQEMAGRSVTALGEHARKVLETHRLVLAQVEDRLRGATDQEIRSAPWLRDYLARSIAQEPQMGAIWVIGPDGLIAAANRPELVDRRTRIDRDYFQAARQGAEWFVSAAYTGRVDGILAFNLGRRRAGADGRFDGLVLAAIYPASFMEHWTSMMPQGEGQRIGLYRTDGTPLAQAGVSTANGPEVAGRLAAAFRERPEGTWTGPSPVDGVMRIQARQSFPALGIVVEYASDQAAVLAGWTRAVQLWSLVALLGAILLVGTVLMLRRAGQQELAAERARLQGEAEAHANDAQSRRMQALGQLAGGIALDFNNVLQAVEGATTLIDRQPANEASVRRLATLANDAAKRGAAITNRLLALGQRSDLRAERLDVTTMLGEVRETLTHSLGSGITVRIEVRPDLPPLLADREQLETALINLATNARDAMPKGGSLTLAAETEMVSMEGAGNRPAGMRPGRYLRLAVTDTGTGMDAATLARAGEPFFTTKPLGIGTGLGLPMARGFAEQSGGALQIDTKPGEGTTVTLWLPVAEAGAMPRPEATMPAPGKARSSSRLLVVDDEDLVREVLAEYLEQEGFSVLVAASGNEALSLLAAGEAVDVLMTDFAMPGMDGITLIRAAHDIRPGLPAVLLTGYSGDDAALRAGGTEESSFSLLHKPIRIKGIVERIEALLGTETD